MVKEYWDIGKKIYEVCGENDRAIYGKQVLEDISQKLTAEFGKGFDITNLRKMCQFYRVFPIRDTMCLELSWSHYRLLMRVENNEARNYYVKECAKASWSVRQLQRQINTMYYNRTLASKDKEAVAKEIEISVPKPDYESIIKDSYVSEFLDLPANDHFYEILP